MVENNTYISKDNFIVVYNMNNGSSKEFATYYANKHNMTVLDETTSGGTWESAGQIVGIQCSTNEILDDEDTFNQEILYPLQGFLDADVSSGNPVWGIVLGYKVPGGFKHYRDTSSSGEYDIISSTSRVSRGCSKKDGSFHEFSQSKLPNKFYNESVFKRFTESNIDFALVVSRIDAPTLLQAESYVDNAETVGKQFFVGGKVYIDPYSEYTGSLADDYKENILDFCNYLLPQLKLNSFITKYIDPYIDSVIPFVEDDSFIWSWGTPYSNSDFFQFSTYPRVFFYNADIDGAYSIREPNSVRWPYLSMKYGYSSCAGAMSDPGIDGFLNPMAFFNALFHQATIGEAYFYSLPYLDWTMTLFGDPLISISFPVDLEDTSETIEENESWFMESKELARVAAYLLKKQKEAEEIREQVVNLNDKRAELCLLNISNNLFVQSSDKNISYQLKKPIYNLFNYPIKRFRYQGLSQGFPDIDIYLSDKGYKISRLLSSNVGDDTISESNLFDEGWWEFEFLLQDDFFGYVNYYFQLEIYQDEDLTIPAINNNGDEVGVFDSYINSVGWSYETRDRDFRNIPISGVSSSYIGRRIRYTSRKDSLVSSINDYLNRGQVYYFKIRQYIYVDEIPQYFDWRVYSDIIYT